MLVSKIQGGLGNQLFQWALVKNLSKKYNCDLLLDLSYFKNQPITNTFRNYKLSEFPFFDDKTTESFDSNKSFKLIDDFHFNNFQIKPTNTYYFDGFWQSEKYFIDTHLIIKDKMKIPEETFFKLKSKYPLLSESISLHIRRGDFLNLKDYHPTQSIDYYKKALEQINEDLNILIFSDDIEWCKQNLLFHKMTFVEGLTDVESLWLMSLCKHNIIANSTFSWWGAWLNKNENKIVVAPKLWFGHRVNLNTSDLIPTNWIKI